ncbi:hypothetical protein QFC22_002224 [Naganishia vaughanmartiniae]|uniref:Uncharacterized protein n=1 Tax=Naganishia vaughanmartiniae TaxID=1424756 RepID=A0ACC2XE00_9TREE|nr:hypothetical protein QFC22_002224 [Naganishia vaughanmartiniae]
MSLLDTLVFQPILLAIHAADIFTQSLSSAATAGLIPSGLCLSTAPSKHKIPKHVAFSLVISDEWKLESLDRRTRHDVRDRRNSVNRWHDSPLRSANKGKGRETWEQAESDDEEWSTAERQALLLTIQEAVRWAVVRDISEISVWNEDGLLDEHLESLISFLVERPPTPPASGTSSPPPYDRQRCTNTTNPDEIHTAFPATSVHPSSPPDLQSSWIQVKTPHMAESHTSIQSSDPAEALAEFNASRSFTVWPDLEDILPGYNHCDQASFSTSSTISSKTTSPLLRGTNGTSPVTVHVLSRDAGDPMMAHITKKLIADGVPSELVSQQMIEELIQGMFTA